MEVSSMDSVFIWESSRRLFFQQAEEVFAELCHLWRDHRLTIRLELVVDEVFLVVILGDIKLIHRSHLCDDGIVPDFLGIQLADQIFSSFLLLGGVIKNGGAILRADVCSMTVQGGGVVDRKEHI